MNLITQDKAQALAIQVLIFLAENPRHLAPFLAETGLAVEEIRQEAQSPTFLSGVLNYLITSESAMKDFCTAAQLEPAFVLAVAHWLGGMHEVYHSS